MIQEQGEKMYTDKNIETWYGKLTIKSQEFIVIYDKRVVSSSKDRISLYHTGRKQLVEFVEDIAKKNLSDLTTDELKLAEDTYKKEWQSVFSEYKKAHPSLFPQANKSGKKVVEDIVSDSDYDDEDDDEDMINIDDLETDDEEDEDDD